MLKRKPAQLIANAENGFEFLDGHGVRVSIPPNGLVYRDAQGNEVPVTGDVLVHVTPLDVTDDDQLMAAPGPLLGRDMSGNPAAPILSYGMVEFEFATPDGRKLNLASGKVALIEIPVFVDEHPDGTPVQPNTFGQSVWSFDETTGEWVEESNSAAVVESPESPTGMALEATVKHFSWWNYDVIGKGGCLNPVLFNGIPSGERVSLVARSVRQAGNAWGSRFASRTTVIPANGRTQMFFPGLRMFEMEGVVEAETGLYVATNPSAMSCRRSSGGVEPIVLDFSGPSAPLIRDLSTHVLPVFSAANTVQANDVVVRFDVIGAETLTVQIDPENDGPIEELRPKQKAYRLRISGDTLLRITAENAVGTQVEDINITYVADSLPIVQGFGWSYDQVSTAFVLSWNVIGADRINYGYVPPGINRDPVTDGVLVGSSTAENGRVLINLPVDQLYDLYAIFRNSNGEVVRKVRATINCNGPLGDVEPQCRYGGEMPF